jgi:hypothetical protein
MTTTSEPVAAERFGILADLEGLPVASHARAATFATLDRIVQLAARIFDVPMVAVNILRGDIQVTAAGLGAIVTGLVTPRDESFCDHTIRTPDPLVVADARADSRFADNPSVIGDPNIRFYAGQPLAAPTGERIGALCLVDDRPRDLTDDQIDLLRELADWVERELTMQDELDQAAEVQAHLLPKAPPPTQGLEVAGTCQPARTIGGDFFDWFVLPDGRVQLIIADVMGKGLGTGIVAANVRAVLRAALRFNEPAEAVTRAALALDDDLEHAGVFVTAFIARIDQRDWSVEYVDAGHGLALVLGPDGAMRRLETGGLPLGALRGEQWTSGRTILQPGETMMTASDGYLDPFADGAAVMAFATSANQAASTAQDLVDAWARVASEFDAEDDMTFLAARRPA